MHSIIQSGLIPGGKDVKKGRQTILVTVGLRRDEAQNCSVQTKLENTPEHSVLDQLESCSDEGIDVLSNEISRDHPSSHSASSVY